MLHRKTAARVAALASVALVLPATSAFAQRVLGTPGDDALKGSPTRDVLFARAGNDTADAFAGHDRVFGGPGSDVLNGNAGRDLLAGGPGDDRLQGGAGNDRLFGNQGADTLSGGDGNDRLWSLALVDVPLPGADTVRGEGGNDRIRTRDGEPDLINCGNGFDVAQLDPADVVEDATPLNANGSCEVVVRRAPNRTDSSKEDATEAPSETSPPA